MSSLVPLTLFGWALLVPGLFLLLGPRRAVAVAHVAGWLFLPVATYDLPLVEFDKAAAIAAGCLVGVVLFDLPTLLALRPRVADLGVVALCVSPLFSSLSNDLGAYDGFANAVGRLFLWGAPYLFGRLYFADRDGLEDLCRALVWSGLVYLPLCLWELRMSPQLHQQVYGFYAHASGFTQVMRFGGWRPTVFQHHGLMLGTLMGTSALCAYALVRADARRRGEGLAPARRFLGLRATWCAAALLAVTVACKSSAAIVWTLVGVALLWLGSRTRVRTLAWALVAVPLVYAGVRTTNAWDGSGLVAAIESAGLADRAESLDYRLEAERLLADKALERPVFGWGGYMRGFVPWDRSPSGFVVPDGLWTLVLNMNGLFGLTALLWTLLAPLVLWLRAHRGAAWCRGEGAVGAGLALAVALFAVDCLLNAMVTPLFLVATGAVTGAALAPAAARLGRSAPVRRAAPSSAGGRLVERWRRRTVAGGA